MLNADSESKVTHWVYGSYDKPVEATLLLPRKNDIQAVSNPLKGKTSNSSTLKELLFQFNDRLCLRLLIASSCMEVG